MKNGDLFYGIRWVWFDLDDTLIDFKANSRAALKKIYASERLDRWYATQEEWINSYESINHKLWQKYALGEINREQLILERFSRPFIIKGETSLMSDRMSSHLHPVYLDALADEDRLIPGAVEILDAVRRCGMHTGVLSNGFKEVQYRKIDRCGLTHHIDTVVLSDDIGINKPDPAIFRYAERRSGVKEQSAHIMIGDNKSTDVDGAIGVGWQAIWLDRDRQTEIISDSSMRIASFSELIGFFDKTDNKAM